MRQIISSVSNLVRFFGNIASETSAIRLSMNNNIVRLCEGPSLAYHAKNAAAVLLSGDVIAVPTDTLYGIAALAQNNEAIDKIYHIKKRSSTKPLAICVAEVEDVYKWGKVTVPHSLLTRLLPGAVTLIFHRTPRLNPSLNPGTDLVGIRIPDHEFIRTLARCCCDSPLALTSANVSAKTSPLHVGEFSELWSKLHSVYDGGPIGGDDEDNSECREGSTIVDLSQPGAYRLVRRGVAFERTTKILQQFNLTLVD